MWKASLIVGAGPILIGLYSTEAAIGAMCMGAYLGIMLTVVDL